MRLGRVTRTSILILHLHFQAEIVSRALQASFFSAYRFLLFWLGCHRPTVAVSSCRRRKHYWSATGGVANWNISIRVLEEHVTLDQYFLPVSLELWEQNFGSFPYFPGNNSYLTGSSDLSWLSCSLKRMAFEFWTPTSTAKPASNYCLKSRSTSLFQIYLYPRWKHGLEITKQVSAFLFETSHLSNVPQP